MLFVPDPRPEQIRQNRTSEWSMAKRYLNFSIPYPKMENLLLNFCDNRVFTDLEPVVVVAMIGSLNIDE